MSWALSPLPRQTSQLSNKSKHFWAANVTICAWCISELKRICSDWICTCLTLYRKSRYFGYLGIFGCLLADIGPVHGIVLLHLHRLHLLLDCVHGRAVKPLVENSMSIMNVFWWKGNLWGWGAPEAGTETGWVGEMGWGREGASVPVTYCAAAVRARGGGELTWIIFWDITHFNFSTSYSIDSVYQQCTIVLWVKSANRGD